ncbi:MAG: alpha/beta fold hydrolase [Rhodospirillaceae bacterium]|nr:alpha/beta fold hydrolase [Rhodospirillaceae bacterium]MBT5943379.1 alpha/beta fold hydrolase [Rhodospirillaceae bacterium]MBT6405555.1 alpha/beta fold hydrolase [Rhodospirillaceae bacterium]MBT6535404.1 alpha/beta fold hydrolase [Rhodospirillaceae bacterium]
MAQIEANGITQYYDIQGDGPPLLLVAGMGGTANYWAEQVSFFSRTHTVISYDQRGTGRTSHEPVTGIEQLRDDLLALLDALGFEKLDYLGHSTGGNIGQIIAIENPERLRNMVIYASTTHGDAYRSKVWRVRRSILENQGSELYGDMTSLMLYPPEWIAENSEVLEAQQAAQVAMLAPVSVMTSRIEAVQAFDRRDQLSDIDVPILVLCARDDHQTPAYFSAALAAAIPGAEYKLLDYGGHACSRTVPGEFNRIVAEYFAR